MNTIRTLAMQWWNNLPFNSSNTKISKTHYYNQYFGYKGAVFTMAKDYTELTGREIESIFYNEVILKWFEAHPLYHLCNGMQKETIIAAYLQEHSNTSTPAKVFDELNDMMDSNPLFKEHSK